MAENPGLDPNLVRNHDLALNPDLDRAPDRPINGLQSLRVSRDLDLGPDLDPRARTKRRETPDHDQVLDRRLTSKSGRRRTVFRRNVITGKKSTLFVLY